MTDVNKVSYIRPGNLGLSTQQRLFSRGLLTFRSIIALEGHVSHMTFSKSNFCLKVFRLVIFKPCWSFCLCDTREVRVKYTNLGSVHQGKGTRRGGGGGWRVGRAMAFKFSQM